MRPNPVLAPSNVRYIPHLGHTPNIAEPHVASNVRYIALSMSHHKKEAVPQWHSLFLIYLCQSFDYRTSSQRLR